VSDNPAWLVSESEVGVAGLTLQAKLVIVAEDNSILPIALHSQGCYLEHGKLWILSWSGAGTGCLVDAAGYG
jgi:hypothetical protein